jgi:thiamine-phosphate pyrophosphorylase
MSNDPFINSNDHEAAVQAIVDAHQSTLALSAIPPTLSQNGLEASVYRAARQACLRVGFIEADAACVASAWQKQAERTGHFNANHWPTEPLDFGIQALPRSNSFPACPRQLGLYAVLPDAAWVARMARAGVPTLQLRFKSDDPAAISREVQAAVRAVQGTDALLFINDHWQEAIAAGAYGVHLGQEDLGTANLDAIRQAGLRLGLSTHGYAEMCLADTHAPSYMAMGAVFPTTLKRMKTAAQGTGRLHAYAQLLREYPLVAIGGLTVERARAVLDAGAESAAVSTDVLGHADPEARTREWAALSRARA